MDIQQAQSLIVEETRARMAALIAPVPIAEKAEALRDISRLFQALAICKVLVEADVTGFRAHLIRSGQSRRYYLQQSAEQGNTDDRFLGLSRVEAVLDACVAGDLPLACEIAQRSIDRWHRGWEYEDDFAYFAFIHGLLLDPAFHRGATALDLLRQFERALQGQPCARFELCKAVHAQDVAQFELAFERLLQQHAAAMEAKRAKFTEYSSDAAFWPKSFVSVEALAWIGLGHRIGLHLQGEYRFCPAAARGPFDTVHVPDLFESLQRALSEP